MKLNNIIIFLIFLLLISYGLCAQKIATKKIKTIESVYENGYPTHYDNFFLVQDREKSFIISRYKTTNKEYLCFLQWMYRVFGVDNSKIYQQMIPDTINYPDIFNPLKLNEPVKGITYEQAIAFCHWRSDRLNEYILIKEGILHKNFYQFNEHNFNTEAYLSGQYENGIKADLKDIGINKLRQAIHLDFFLIPKFYIASKEQILICDSLIKSTKFKRKRRIKSDLDWWFSNEFMLYVPHQEFSPFYLFKSKLALNTLSDMGKVYSFIKRNQTELANKTINFDTTDVMFSEKDYRLFNLHKYKSQMRYFKYFADSLPNPFKREYPHIDKKDKYGSMSFIYIADNFDSSPICINKSIFEENFATDISNKGFYCAMNLPYSILVTLLVYPSILQYRY